MKSVSDWCIHVSTRSERRRKVQLGNFWPFSGFSRATGHAQTIGGMNSILDVCSASRPNGNSEIHDLRDYFVGFIDYNGK